MSPTHLLAAAIAAAIALPVTSASATTSADTATRLARVTVSTSTSRLPEGESALPNTITVIDRAQLERQLAVTQDISQVLANLIPAFAPSRQKLTSSGESLRGRQPLYMVDGVPQSTPLRDGARDAHTIDPAMIERIEVIHGANALQGLGASGGIINIITKRAPREDGQFHEVRIGGSSALPTRDDGVGTRGSYLFGSTQGAFDFVGGVSYAQEGLYHDGAGRAIAVNGVQGDLMDARSHNLFAKAGWTLDDARRLQLTANRYELTGDGDYASVDGDVASGLPATSVRGQPEGQPPRNLSTALTLDYTDQALAGGYFQAQLYWVDFEARYGGSDWENFFNTDPADAPAPSLWFDQSQNASEKLGGKFSWSRRDIAGLPLRLTLGLDVQRDETFQSLLVSGLDWVPHTTYTSVSPLLQAEWWFGDQLMLTGGLRHERGELWVDDYRTLPTYGSQLVTGGRPETTETLPNAGAVWYVNDTLNLYASYAEGYTVADVGRVLRAIDQPGQSVDRLVDLSPVIADNREVGLDYDDGRWLAHVAAYWSDSEFGSRLAYDPATDNYTVRRQPIQIHGIEANLALQFADTGRVGLGYATADGRYDANLDGRFETDLEGANISPDRITAFWEQAWLPTVSTRLQASRAQDRQFRRNGAVQQRFTGYTTLDLQAHVTLPVGALSLGIENLTDRQYIGYHAQTLPSDDDYVAGRGRVLHASWAYRF